MCPLRHPFPHTDTYAQYRDDAPYCAAGTKSPLASFPKELSAQCGAGGDLQTKL